jgi:hypothetical protein
MKITVIMLGMLGLLGSTPAFADGFAITDLTTAPIITEVLGAGYVEKVESDRITYVCFECPGLPMIDVLMGQTTDGTEGRLRSGETTFADMQALCQAKDPDCVLDALIVDPAVGYITTYRFGAQSGHTLVIMRDGDMLTIRSLSENPETARANARMLERSLIPEIVGN